MGILAIFAGAKADLTSLLDGLSASLAEQDGQSPDLVSIARSRPGVGDRLAALFAWAYDPLREGNHRRLRAACGVPPRRIQSGSKERAEVRRSAPFPLQQAAYLLAGGAVRWDARVEAFNAKLKSEGKNVACRRRTIADHQFRVLCAMVRNGTLFDPDYSGKTPTAAA